MNPVRIGMVGLGWFGRIHRQVWDACKDAEVAAICDIDSLAASGEKTSLQDAFHTTARSGGAATAADLPIYTDIGDLLAQSDVDVVDITTPEAAHAEHVQLAIEAGKSVIVEKPFTTDGVAAGQLAEMARDAGVHIFVGNILRFDSRYMHVMDQFETAGQLPTHLSLQRHFQRSALEVYGRVNPFYGACIHDIDLAIWSQRSRPARVLGHVSRDQETGAVIAASGILEWPEGNTAVIQNAWVMPSGTPAGFAFESCFLGTEQSMTVRSLPVVEQISGSHSEWPEFFFWPGVGGEVEGALRRELTHYLDCIRNGVPTDRLPVDQAVWGIETADALVRSADTDQWVAVAP